MLKDTYEQKEKKLTVDEENVIHYLGLLDKDCDQKVSYKEFENYFVKAVRDRTVN